MTAQQLKNSILQMAVQGKLVPQDPTDEPASVLLERIRTEKEQMIKEGKIKREKNPSVIFRGADNTPYEKVGDTVTPLEVPFEIPKSWEWARISNLFQIEMGQSPDGNSVSESLTGMEFHQGKVFFGKKLIQKSNQTTTAPTKIAMPNSVLLCVRAPVGKVNITDRELCIGRGLCALKPLGGITTNFAYHLLETYEDTFIKQATGTTFVAITGEVVKTQLVPVPPLEEQARIIARLYKLFPFIEEYAIAYDRQVSLDRDFPLQLKKSILQQAIQGKLVPQDPADEPAEALLEHIRAEKQRLVQEGKIKKDKHESVIFRRDNSHYELVDGVERCIDEEIPFEIPKNWQWERWGNISYSIQYGYNAPAQTLGKIRMVRISDIQDNKVIWSAVPFCDIAESDIEAYLLRPNDILFARTGGTVGKSFLVKDVPEPAIYAGYLIRTRYSALLSPEYLKFFMESDLYWSQLKKGTTATAQPNCNGKTLSQMLLPIPPRSEQYRIVAKIEELLPPIQLI